MNRGDFEQMIATADRALSLLSDPRDQAHFAALKAGALYELKRYQEADAAASYALQPEAEGMHLIWRPKALRIRTACAIRARRLKNARWFATQLLEMA